MIRSAGFMRPGSGVAQEKKGKNALKMAGIICNDVQKTHYLRLFETSTQAFMQASKQRSKLLIGELASIG